MHTEQTPETNAEPEFTGTATYCPEDNKLRLYIGRVPRPEYDALRAEGWKALHKQREAGGGDFVATWTPQRRDTALEYAGVIDDEDMGPAERAADRAERFAMYREKRTNEATGHADRFDAGPTAHGFQSQARAERSARRHDRVAGRAVDSWSKAEYWQSRTAGVISHALHVASPDVRMGRIKILEAEIRKAEKNRAEYEASRARWVECAEMTDAAEQTKRAKLLAGAESGLYNYKHPRPELVKNAYIKTNGASLWSLLEMHGGEDGEPITGAEACGMYLATHGPLSAEGDWLTHYRLRLAYENQMMEAQGGRAALVEMEVGGWIDGKQIRKVVRSTATGRVTSVEIMGTFRRSHYDEKKGESVFTVTHAPQLVNIERASADCYTPPTPEDVAAMAKIKADEKAARPKSTAPALINPTDADAERLQAIWNEQSNGNRWSEKPGNPPTVARLTQAQYSAASKGAYARCESQEITGGGFQTESGGCMRHADCPTVAKVRRWGYRVVILTDKPQKAIPANVWHDPRPAIIEELEADFAALDAATGAHWLPEGNTEAGKLLRKAELVRLVYISSMSQYGWTATGHKWATEQRKHLATVNA